jgi:hypothetical protein
VDPGPASCLFVSDLHGSESRYEKLWAAIAGERPAAVFLGGDLLPHFGHAGPERDFVDRCLAPGFAALRERLGDAYPSVFLILGNDDPRAVEPSIVAQADGGLWAYAHQRRFDLPGGFSVYGYAFVPPTPFLLKDWERYDVSRYVDPGCVSPEEGRRSVDVPLHEIRNATIRDDLERLARRTWGGPCSCSTRRPTTPCSTVPRWTAGATTTSRSTSTSEASPSGGSSRRAARG